MKAPVIYRKIAGLRQHFLRLSLLAILDRHAGADGAAIGFHSDQLDLEPVILAGDIVAQQRWRLIQIHDQDIHVAIVIEIAESASAAAMARGDARSGHV